MLYECILAFHFLNNHVGRQIKEDGNISIKRCIHFW